MYRLLLVAMDGDTFAKMVQALQEDTRVEVAHAGSGDEALDALGNKPADLVVAAERLGDMSGLDFAEKLVAQNPMINCALVSSLGDDDFHEASEGLGILMKIPTAPGAEQAVELLQKLKVITGLGV